jgi:hypothetical protein
MAIEAVGEMVWLPIQFPILKKGMTESGWIDSNRLAPDLFAAATR